MKPSVTSNDNLANLLGGLSVQEFLQNYWQKRPLFIPGALNNFTSPVTPDELAGLACEPEVESRLVMEYAGRKPWVLEHGPFSEDRFADLPETHWSLLVQECNKYIPELAELMERFAFIPHWRIDDIMASYAPAQGSVGPHVDQYDVFLIQAMGTRRWQISTQPVAKENFLPGLELNIMRDFVAEQEWLAQPGDLLYLPPGVAHYGAAVEDCITLSVGFRAPTHQEIVSAFLEDAASRIDPELRYADPDLTAQAHSGEISLAARQKIRTVINQAVADDHAIDDWFGRYVTEPKSGHFGDTSSEYSQPELDTDTLAKLFKEGAQLERDPAIRFAFIQGDQEITLFVDGETFKLDSELKGAIATLCDKQHFQFTEFAPVMENEAFLELITQLHNHDYLQLHNTEFEIQQVTWQEAERPLRAIRTSVFIIEQNVPAELEWDDQDKHSIHLLARNRDQRPIGTARILNDGHIGRLAVLAEYRGKGVGSALLKTAIKIAQKNNMQNVVLSAQTQALDFYRHHGFVADDEVYMDAGIPHQHMTLTSTHMPHSQPAEPVPPLELDEYKLGESNELISLSFREHHRDIALHMTQQATRSLYLFTNNLDASLYNTETFIEAVKYLAIAGANSKVYILLQDPTNVVLRGHRIVELARRLSSHIFIHRADEEDQKRVDNFMLLDQIGFIRRPHPNRYEGAACYNNPAEVRKYLKFFADAWERSHPEPELRRLHL